MGLMISRQFPWRVLRKSMLDEIDELLELYELEEMFEVLDITPRRVLEILIAGGYVILPPFLERGII